MNSMSHLLNFENWEYFLMAQHASLVVFYFHRHNQRRKNEADKPHNFRALI